MTGKKVALLWDEVQGSSDLKRLESALAGCSDEKNLVLDGWTPLQFLCENRSVENDVRANAIALLLQFGIDVNAVDENGWSALHLLCKMKSSAYGEADISASLDRLLHARADAGLQTTDRKKTALHLLCENDTITERALQTLLSSRANVNAVDEDGNVPLHYLAENSSLTEPMLTAILSVNANPNIKNQFQATPFHYLCQNNAVTAAMVKTALQHKANPNIQNNIGNTPLHYLCENYKVSVAMLQEMMTSKKVNVTITNSLGRTAFDCISPDNHECITFMQQFVAPNLTPSASAQTAVVGGEDPSELPPALQKPLIAWNASLPPFDASFYNAISCEAAFSTVYDEVQEASVQLNEAPTNSKLLEAWERSLAQWRDCILLAYMAFFPPTIWHQYAEKYNRAVPSDLSKRIAVIEDVWKRFPDQSQRRDRFEALSDILKK